MTTLKRKESAMYSIDINTENYDIKLIARKFGKKAQRTLKQNIKKTDITKAIKKFRKSFKNLNLELTNVPY